MYTVITLLYILLAAIVGRISYLKIIAYNKNLPKGSMERWDESISVVFAFIWPLVIFGYTCFILFKRLAHVVDKVYFRIFPGDRQ